MAMMALMRSNDVRDDLQDGIDAAPMPAMAPDGGLAFTPARPIVEPPPRMCELGPCRHYHRLAVQMDAANPMSERRSDGSVVHHARLFHTQVSHYCYPDVGIETELGSLPVIECNRWVPIGRIRRPKALLRGYQRELAAWDGRREREAEGVDAAVAEDAPEDAMALEISVVFEGDVFAPSADDAIVATSMLVAATAMMTVAEVIELAVPRLVTDPSPFKPGITLEQCERAVSIGAWPVRAGDPLANLDVTIGQMGLDAEECIVVTLTMKESA
jgi:hypothetical protein